MHLTRGTWVITREKPVKTIRNIPIYLMMRVGGSGETYGTISEDKKVVPLHFARDDDFHPTLGKLGSIFTYDTPISLEVSDRHSPNQTCHATVEGGFLAISSNRLVLNHVLHMDHPEKHNESISSSLLYKTRMRSLEILCTIIPQEKEIQSKLFEGIQVHAQGSRIVILHQGSYAPPIPKSYPKSGPHPIPLDSVIQYLWSIIDFEEIQNHEQDNKIYWNPVFRADPSRHRLGGTKYGWTSTGPTWSRLITDKSTL